MNPVQIGRIGILALALAGISCGSVIRDGSGTSFLIVDSLTGSAGNTVRSSVSANTTDMATVRLSVGLKDPGPGGAQTAPTQNQAITVDRYRVVFVRADGRNTQGVDVPYAFDGGITLTLFDQGQATFPIVRQIAKSEAPLAALERNQNVTLSMIADVTFYGRDQTGRAVSATGRMSVEFVQ
jgi:hypothetical protein